MKLIKNLALSLLTIFAISCGDPELPFETFEDLGYGAYARNLKQTGTYNVFDLNGSSVDIEVEFYDENKGKNVASYRWTVAYTTKDTTKNISAQHLLTIDASSFGTSASGLPGTTINLDLPSVVEALGLTLADVSGRDVFSFSSMITKTDGSTFDASNTGTNFGSSAFLAVTDISQTLLCIPDAPLSGDYVIKMQDSFGDGWQGSVIIVTLDTTATEYSIPNLYDVTPRPTIGSPEYVSATATVTVPVGTSTLTFAWKNGNWPGENKAQIFTPSGALGISIGPSPAEGEFFLDLCNG